MILLFSSPSWSVRERLDICSRFRILDQAPSPDCPPLSLSSVSWTNITYQNTDPSLCLLRLHLHLTFSKQPSPTAVKGREQSSVFPSDSWPSASINALLKAGSTVNALSQHRLPSQQLLSASSFLITHSRQIPPSTSPITNSSPHVAHPLASGYHTRRITSAIPWGFLTLAASPRRLLSPSRDLLVCLPVAESSRFCFSSTYPCVLSFAFFVLYDRSHFITFTAHSSVTILTSLQKHSLTLRPLLVSDKGAPFPSSLHHPTFGPARRRS